MEELYLHENMIADIPSELTLLSSLQRMTLHFNLLNKIPTAVISMDSLIWLTIHHNPIHWGEDDKDFDPQAVLPRNVLYMSDEGTKSQEHLGSVIREILIQRMMVSICHLIDPPLDIVSTLQSVEVKAGRKESGHDVTKNLSGMSNLSNSSGRTNKVKGPLRTESDTQSHSSYGKVSISNRSSSDDLQR